MGYYFEMTELALVYSYLLPCAAQLNACSFTSLQHRFVSYLYFIDL